MTKITQRTLEKVIWKDINRLLTGSNKSESKINEFMAKLEQNGSLNQ